MSAPSIAGAPLDWHAVLPSDERSIYAAAGYGRPAPELIRPVLLIVDATVNFTGDRREPILESIRRFPHSCGEPAWDSLDAIARLHAAARRTGAPVVYTHGPRRKTRWTLGGWSRTTDSPLPEHDAAGEAFVPAIEPGTDDLVLEKLRPSAFFGTPLASLLHDGGRASILLCGGTASGCVRATAVDAFSYGFDVAVVEEATFDRSPTSRAVSFYEIDQKYGSVIGVEDAVAVLERKDAD
jgi:nicotinamidase-related amidase